MIREKILFIFFIFLISMGEAPGQYQYDKAKTDKIRWTPEPGQIEGLSGFRMDLNGKWRFSEKPNPGFFNARHQRDWAGIMVPGEWVMQGFEVDTGRYAGYFRTFSIPRSWEGFRIKLKCEAVYSDCKIWINGKEAGGHLGGFTPFELDVTNLIKNGENTISLAVRSESLADTLSSASKYAVHPLGGITRAVYLMALPEVNLASFHVNTRFDDDFEDAGLNVHLKMANESAEPREVSLFFSLTGQTGESVPLTGENGINVQLDEGGDKKITAKFHVDQPLKWDCEHPNLYDLTCEVRSEGALIQSVVRRFGFRQIDVKGNQVFVNNKVIKLKGVCRHEVDPLRGRSLTGNQWYEDVKLFKEGNVNYIRTSHYPPDEALLEACDELGMFVEVESPFCWAKKDQVTDDNYFEAILQPTLEMVERDKSHPSVIIWSLANESHHFEELFKESARLAREADSSRLRIFSQWGPDSDGGILEVANHHYPGPGGPDMYRNSKRPIIFDEYCHLNAYNRFELMTDPGLRDAWGLPFMEMWEKMYKTPAVLGGALWAGIDDSFFLPSGEAVGYGTWGPVDGWRRKKPEFWHMKKVYSPVKIELAEGRDDRPVILKMENRFLFTNLHECEIKWDNNGEEGILKTDIEPGKTGEINLPFTYAEMGRLAVNVYRDSEIPVDQYVFDHSKPEISYAKEHNEEFEIIRNGEQFIAQSDFIKVTVTGEKGKVENAKGELILEEWPALMLVPLNSEGAGIQMTRQTPEFQIFSPEARFRKIESVSVSSSGKTIKIDLTDTYQQAAGKVELTITAGGLLSVDYTYTLFNEVNPRQWGMVFKTDNRYDRISWKRKGLWSVYPEDHIGRLAGEAQLFHDGPMVGLAGPQALPAWSWAEDQNRYGSNDFRSTKRNVLKAALISENGERLTIHSNGLQHIRCWTENGMIHMLVADYDNPGAEGFLRSHTQKWDKPLKIGDTIRGRVEIELIGR